MEIKHYKFDRITLDRDKCFGKPCIRNEDALYFHIELS